jgi:hypothetical protein
LSRVVTCGTDDYAIIDYLNDATSTHHDDHQGPAD